MVRPSSRGFVLPLVAVLLLSLTLLFTTLLKSTGHMNPVYARFKSDFENFYKAESAVLPSTLTSRCILTTKCCKAFTMNLLMKNNP